MTFFLQDTFVSEYADKDVPWGFGPLSRVTYKRTYARPKRGELLQHEDTGELEDWHETCRRVIEGMFTIQKQHCLDKHLPWNEDKARRHAREAYDRLFHFKWTPPGRGLWMMGTDYVLNRGGAALNNCGFTSTKDIDDNFADPFVWMFGMSMLGVGVGFDTRGKGAVEIQAPDRDTEDTHVIEDSREGWMAALRRLLDAFVGDATLPGEWDFSEIRPKGAPIRGFGGEASGPDPLEEMLETLEAKYRDYVGQEVDAELIVDTMNIAGKCVVAGGVRRTAQVSLGDPDDEQFLDLKTDPEKVEDYRWASNNSVVAEVGMDYEGVVDRTAQNGEPGFFWLETAQKYGRMKDDPDHADEGALGSNPCVEQTLWDRELCCLVETYPAHHEDLDDYKRTLKTAYQYAKTVTLVKTRDKKTNAVMLRNRRIGCSMTGIVQAVNRHGYRTLMEWCDDAYDHIQQLDKKYADWLCVPRSIKTTSVKPSGTVSILAGATPGVHWGHAPYYIRRLRIRDTHPLVEACREAGYPIEPDTYANDTVVVEFPVHVENMGRGKHDVPLYEKVDLAAQMQRFWSDNQVSCTAEFDPATEADAIPNLVQAYEDRLKAISFLPATGHGYAQPPYESITPEEYAERKAALDPLDVNLDHDQEDKFCSGEACSID